MTVTRFDTDNLNTAATRALAAREDDLVAAMTGHEAKFREIAQAKTVTDLKNSVDAQRTKPATKTDWVEVFVNKNIAATTEAEQLRNLRFEATLDRILAENLNNMMDASDKATEELRNVAAGNDGAGMFRNLTWKIDGYFTAQAAAVYAKQVLASVECGADLREATMHVLGAAMRKIFSFPSYVRSNGLSGGYRMEALIEAVAADEFRRVATTYLHMDQVPAKLIRN